MLIDFALHENTPEFGIAVLFVSPNYHTRQRLDKHPCWRQHAKRLVVASTAFRVLHVTQQGNALVGAPVGAQSRLVAAQ